MAHIEFLDETMRDGQQSLWGMRMTAGMALPVTPLIDRVGYRVVDLTGSSQFEVLIRECRENPWEGLDLLVQSMPRSKLRAGMRSNAAVTFSVTPDALMDAWIRQLNEHGCRSFWIYDVLFNIDKMHRLAKIAKGYGSEVAGTVMYTLSPVHSDAYFAEKAAQIAASPDIDTILLYDTAGVLDAERIKTLVPAIVARIGGRPLELHSNNRLGQSVQAYLAGIECGVNILHTSTRPLANGPAVPSIEVMARNVTRRGHTHDIDEKLLKPIADHFERVGQAAGYLVNQFAEYDVLSVDHQIPGGMVGTLRAQLAKHGMSDKLEEVFEETAIVRRELGYPGMATPFSQLVGIQAVLNIVTG
ncbi:MAG: pyruvate carboxylase, partial [Gammaproteobacteria bacterium]